MRKIVSGTSFDGVEIHAEDLYGENDLFFITVDAFLISRNTRIPENILAAYLYF